MAIRLDRGTLRKAEKTDLGLLVDAYIARAGVLPYIRHDGKMWKEYRPPEEAFSPDSLKTYQLIPLTNDHPPVGLLTPETVKSYQVGIVGEVRQDGQFLRATLRVTDPEAIAAMEAGKLELSVGYEADVHLTPGEINGERFDAIQKNVRANHVALVEEGRAGPGVRARMDSGAAVMLASEADFTEFGAESRKVSVKKIRLDAVGGVEVEVPETAAQAIEKALSISAEAVQAAKVEVSKTQARADAAEAGLAKAKADLEAAPKKIREEIKARVDLESAATKVLGEVKLDSMNDLDIKRAVIKSVMPELSTDGKPEAYVAALFDMSVVQHAKENSGVAEFLRTAHADATDEKDPEAAYRESISKAFRTEVK